MTLILVSTQLLLSRTPSEEVLLTEQNFRKLFVGDANGKALNTKLNDNNNEIKNKLKTKSTQLTKNDFSGKEEKKETKRSRGKFTMDNQLDQYPELPSNYELLSVLGEGAFSTVYKALDLNTDTTVAIKIIKKENLTGKQITNILNEISIMKKANNHGNILKLLNHYNTKRYCFLVLEYCNGGEIFNKIIEYTYFSEDLSRHVFKQLLSAIDYLHNEVNVAHRDIKPENLLFNKISFFDRSEDEFKSSMRSSDEPSKSDEGLYKPGIGGGTIGVIKLADFGLAKQLKLESHHVDIELKTPCGTAGYTAPEVITCNEGRGGRSHRRFSSDTSKKNYYSKSVDIWSLGCFLYTILCGFPPFYDENPDHLTSKILNGDYVFLSPWWDEVSDESKDLITKMLTIDPETRITVEQIWKHPWVRGSSLESKTEIKNDAHDAKETYFPLGETCYKDFARKHSETDSFLPPPINHSDQPLVSPRANAIKLVFNNPAMTNNENSNLRNIKNGSSPSVQFIENINEYESSTDDSENSIGKLVKQKLPKTPNPTMTGLSKFNFKDALKIERVEDEYASEREDEITSLDQDFTNTCKRNPSQKSNTSIESYESEDSDYQTRSSSIVSGINGDFKFTLNLNDSNILSRRRSSTLKILNPAMPSAQV